MFNFLKSKKKSTEKPKFLKEFIKNPLIQVGDYTYYHNFNTSARFEQDNVVVIKDCKLIIGKFCQIAKGVKFFMSSSNHQMSGLSTYPFFILGEECANHGAGYPKKGDTVVGDDVWLGQGCAIMPGVKIGSGAIIAAYAVVTKDVPPYTIAGGNPATILKQRFSEEVIKDLLQIKWWNWDIDTIKKNAAFISGADITALKKVNRGLDE